MAIVNGKWRKQNMNNAEFKAWFNAQLVPDGDCLLWPRRRDELRNGVKTYGKVAFQGKTLRTHRVAFFLQHGRWPNPNCNHTCDNPACCNPAHLYEGDQQDNVADMVRRGRRITTKGRHVNVGSANGNAKLDEFKVMAIRRLCAAGNTHAAVAALFDVSQPIVNNIVKGRTWKHVKP